MGQIQFPNRQARQILSGTSQARPNLGGVVLGQPGVQLQGTSQARPNLGGVVLAQPGVPLQGHSQARPNFGGVVLAQSGVPLHTAPPTGQQSVQASTTSYTNVRLCLNTIVTFFNAPTGKKIKIITSWRNKVLFPNVHRNVDALMTYASYIIWP